MRRDLLGICELKFDGISFDPARTLSFCRDNAIGVCQIYTDSRILDDPGYLTELRESALKLDVALISHSPLPLNGNLSETLIAAVGELLAYQNEKKLVVHFDESQDLENSICAVQRLNLHGLAACVENYFASTEQTSVLRTVDSFNAVFRAAKNRNLKVCPVLDLPRLFVSDIVRAHDSLSLAKQMMENASRFSGSAMFHFIDFADLGQSRSKWCAIGKGLMPYNEIIAAAKKNNLMTRECILEFETPQLVLQSLEWMDGV
jgi:sugar phosphate isomerase/epimerase